jgi:hypothetical protein
VSGGKALPALTPDANTENRNFQFEEQPTSSPPLIFYNGAKEYNLKRKVKSMKVAPDTLFAGSDVLVREVTREKLLELDIPHLHMHPAIYIHDDGNWYENYWYLTFTERMNCWDRTHSSYDPEPLKLGGYELYEIYTYSIDQALFDKTNIHERLLFKMGGTTEGLLVCHERLRKVFNQGEGSGAMLTLIADY